MYLITSLIKLNRDAILKMNNSNEIYDYFNHKIYVSVSSIVN